MNIKIFDAPAICPEETIEQTNTFLRVNRVLDMGIKVLLLMVLLLLPPLASAKYDPTTRDRLMQEADKLYRLGNYDVARKIYSDIYIEYGDKASKDLMRKCAQCLTLIADASMAERNRQYATAIEKYQAVMELNPHDPKIPKLLKECEKNNNTIDGYSDGRDFVETAAGLNMKMIWVEGGEFLMGGTSEQGSDAESNEQVIRRVKLDSYYIGECEITQEQWEKVMGTSIHQQASKAGGSTRGTGADYPMYYVSWEEAQAFCSELSRLTGRTYCLPTEAQWEYAARGGKKADGTKYSGSSSIDAVAWYSGNSDGCTHPVKNKRANSLDLSDMSGNVWEWCSDWYGDNYNVNDTNNPTGPSFGSNLVLRGGSWDDDARYCRVSNRGSFGPGSRSYNCGFRVVVLPDRSSSIQRKEGAVNLTFTSVSTERVYK